MPQLLNSGWAATGGKMACVSEGGRDTEAARTPCRHRQLREGRPLCRCRCREPFVMIVVA